MSSGVTHHHSKQHLNQTTQLSCKTIVIGDPGVGKSAFIEQFANHEFNEDGQEATPGMKFLISSVSLLDGIVKL